MEWTDMVHYQQQMQKIIRFLLPVHKSVLTASECELLAHLYLRPEQNTPGFAQYRKRHEERGGEPLPEISL